MEIDVTIPLELVFIIVSLSAGIIVGTVFMLLHIGGSMRR